MEKEFEKNAKDCFNQKKYFDCLKECFKCMSINPHLIWIYELAGYSYFNLKMFSQSRGCFNNLLKMKKNNIYSEMMNKCYEEENQWKKDHKK